MYRKLYRIGIIAYIVQFVFSILFYKERILFLDTSFTLFHILKDNFFAIQVYRFGDAFNQLFPLVAARAGLSLNSVIMSYSLGYMGYYFICYVICGSLLKQYDFALIILLLNLLFVTETFYWITSQLPESIALLTVILAFLGNKHINTTRPFTWFIVLLTTITVAFFHPLTVFVLLYAGYFFLHRDKSFANRKLLFVTGLIYFLAIIVKAVAFRTPYERYSLSGIKNFVTQFPDYFTLYANQRFLITCLTKYYWIPILFSGIVAFYTARSNWKNIAIFIAFFLGYLLLVNVSYPTSATPLFYIESLYLPLGIFLALPFVFDILPVLATKKTALPVFVLIILTGLIRIYSAHTAYTARLDYERKYLDKYGEKKIIAKATQQDKDMLLLLWGAPYEMLLLSECERCKPASIIIDDAPQHRLWAGHVTNALVVNWDVFPYRELNSRYFHFTDTTSSYTIDE